MKKLIRAGSTLSTGNLDQVGEVFTYKGKILRGIRKESVDWVRNIIDSGLINKLSKKSLFPKTKVTNYYTSRFPLVLEHERIGPTSYPQEWSFNMLKDAAITTLRVNKLANEYGYQIIDANSSNIVFNNCSPMFVDLGSFIKIEKAGGWFASEGFLKILFYPLSLWSLGYPTFATKLLLGGGEAISHLEYRKIKNPLNRLVPDKIYSKFADLYFPLSRISSVPENLIKNRVSPLTFSLFLFLKQRNLLPFQKFNTDKFLKMISKMKNPSSTYWEGYQQSSKSYPKRFEEIAKIVKEKKIKSITDLASNNGSFAKLLLKKGHVKQAFCIDYDKNAIDQLYLSSKNSNSELTPVVQNILRPLLGKNNETLKQRFQSEAVAALAITHHLILTQYFLIDKILSTLTSFATKYVFVEFMPLGLWNGRYAPPVPKWYSQKWFEKNLSKYCKVEKIIPLEKNRVLFVGKIKNKT